MSQDPSIGNAAEPELSIDEIRERAYDLWDRNHRPEGYELRFWLMAERELKAERRAKLEYGGWTERDEASRSTNQNDMTASAESAS
jgi:hypothetical protein